MGDVTPQPRGPVIERGDGTTAPHRHVTPVRTGTRVLSVWSLPHYHNNYLFNGEVVHAVVQEDQWLLPGDPTRDQIEPASSGPWLERHKTRPARTLRDSSAAGSFIDIPFRRARSEGGGKE